jgi:arsenate reductase
MDKRKILFICEHNSGRSQMAEYFLNHIAPDRFEAESAGLEPRPLNPLVLEGMKEIGADLSDRKSDDVFEFYKQGRLYDYVITVCDESADARCPIFPGIAKRLHWPFPDPSKLTGSHEEKMTELRKIRDQIEKKLNDWVASLEES